MAETVSLLVVDDDARICRLLSRYLSNEGYRVYTATCGHDMRQIFASIEVNLVILDLVLANEDGLALARELRSHSEVPIIMLTGKADMIDRVVGLEIGADDYVTKPFEERELLARIRSVLRRSSPTTAIETATQSNVACFEGWELHLASHQLNAPDGTDITLTTHEFQLLCAMVRRPQRIFTREEIAEIVAGKSWAPLDRSIDVLVAKLRKKLGDDPNRPGLIQTVRGTGYRFIADVNLR
jgi:DNA-binding response OmpR family regulator